MGIGHLAVGLASKRWAPAASLGWLMLAPVFVDMLWSVFILVGIERAHIVPGITKSMPLDLEYMPISHSLVGMTVWGVVLGGAYFALHQDRRVAVVLFAGVLSHFLLDWISHRPDMPLLPDGPHVGLGLWNFPVPALLVEVALVLGGLALYMHTTRARTPRGNLWLIVLVGVLLAINAGAYFGPPPPDITPMAALNLSTLIVVWIFARIDRRRELRRTA
jgi:hypothetical protein